MADGLFYVDSRGPFISGDVGSVTLAATDKALIPAANIPIIGGNYFSFIGKAVRIRLFGRLVTAATPGNGTFSLYYGTGADANGVVVAASAAMTLTASMTTGSSWKLEMIVRCRTMGATGTLFGTGMFEFLNSATTTTAATSFMIPAAAPAASASVDLTAALLLSPQFKRSGSTAETLQVHDVSYEALN
jgi:hypothetical protein